MLSSVQNWNYICMRTLNAFVIKQMETVSECIQAGDFPSKLSQLTGFGKHSSCISGKIKLTLLVDVVVNVVWKINVTLTLHFGSLVISPQKRKLLEWRRFNSYFPNVQKKRYSIEFSQKVNLCQKVGFQDPSHK